MRKLLLLTLVLFVFAAPAVMAQKNAIKVNLLSPVVSTLNLAYEHVVSEDASFQIGFFYTGAKVQDDKFSGFGITPEYRFYLSSKPAPAGFYAAPFLRYSKFDFKGTEGVGNGASYEGTLSNFGGGVVFGRQWVFKERITLDIFIGPRYMEGEVKYKNQQGSGALNPWFINGFGVRGGVTFGVAF